MGNIPCVKIDQVEISDRIDSSLDLGSLAKAKSFG